MKIAILKLQVADVLYLKIEAYGQGAAVKVVDGRNLWHAYFGHVGAYVEACKERPFRLVI